MRTFVWSMVITSCLLLAGCGGGDAPVDGFIPASSHIYSGVKLYYGTGSNKTYGFEVLGGNDNYHNPATGQSMRGLKVRYPDGSEEWKDRNSVISGDLYWVKADDPALKAEQWQEFSS